MSKIDDINNNILICIPTYRRQFIDAMCMIKNNPQIRFNICVRKDEYENGYYDIPFFDGNDNVRFIKLENVDDIGTTREAILNYAYDHDYKYVLMIDDTIYSIVNIGRKMSFVGILHNCLDRLENDPLASKAFGFIFPYHSQRLDTYFNTQLCQTYILNTKVCKENDLHFYRLKEVGVEDLYFYYQAVKKGLVALSDKQFVRIGQHPSAPNRKGGCHDENKRGSDEQTERMNKLLEVIENDSEHDKEYIEKVHSVLYPGTQYIKMNTQLCYDRLIVPEINYTKR